MSTEPTTAPSSCRILIVDDNVDAATMLSVLMQSLGHIVEIAYDGLAALATARAFGPDVVLLDVGLPGMNGYEVARGLRARPETAHILLVALTGYGREEDRRRSKAAGFDCHLIKPVGIESLEALLEQHPCHPTPATGPGTG